MITRTPIIFAMGTADMSNTTLYHEISKYKDICMADVTEIIRIGTKGYLERYERVVAWILGLKRFFPKGWKPTRLPRLIRETPDLPVQGRLDLFNTSDNRGDNHYKRKNRQDNVHLMAKKLSPKRWTQEELDLLEILYKQGKNNSEIADILPRSKKAIQTKLTKLGISKC